MRNRSKDEQILEQHTSVASRRNGLDVICFWKYTTNGDFQPVSPNSMEAGCRNTLPLCSCISKNLYSLAVFSLCTVPAWTLSNLTAERGNNTRATRGHSPPRMTAFMRFTSELFLFSDGEVGVLDEGTKLSAVRDAKRSLRSQVMSRTVDGEMKFCSEDQI